jgi:molybdopterin-guanine dinucleotide biosynthesis protein A
MLTIILQAGGMSTRMGEDKALLPFLGIPLVERLRDRFWVLNSEILVICNDFSRYEYLGLPLHRDVIPGRGALGGLLTALTITETPYLGLIAADMPFASPDLLVHLLKKIQLSDADATLPSTSKGLESLHGVYRRDTCLPLVQDAIARDFWSMISWHAQANIEVLDPRETAAAGSEYTFVNLNTPEEFSTAEEMAVRLNLL